MKTELTIELGSSFIRIYKNNFGKIVDEPNVLIEKKDSKHREFVAFGNDAKEKIGKLLQDERYIFPVKEGKIVDYNACKRILDFFLHGKIGSKNLIKKSCVIVVVSCGLDVCNLKMFQNLFFEVGFGQVFLVPQVIAIAKQINQAENDADLIIDIGGGKTEIAIVTNNMIINGFAINIGGNLMDLGIIDALKIDKKIIVSTKIAEKIKINVASLYSSDTSLTKIWAQDISTNLPKTVTISSKDISNIFLEIHQVIMNAIKALISDVSMEIVTQISKRGVFYSGSGIVAGLEKYTKLEVGIKASIINSKGESAVLGAMKFFDNYSVLNTIAYKLN